MKAIRPQSSRVGAAVIRELNCLFSALLFALVLVFGLVWYLSRPTTYVMHADMPGSELDRARQKSALDQFRSKGACEYFGKRTTWRDRPALEFKFDPGFENDAECVRARAPTGFILEKDGRL